MDHISITDALTGRSVSFSSCGPAIGQGEVPSEAPGLFFPGCSLINYAPAFVAAVAESLESAGITQGTTLLCCGKILDFEPCGAERRAAVDRALSEALTAKGVRRVVAACPNCAVALKRALSVADGPAVEVAPLSEVLADMGCQIEASAVERVLAAKGCDGCAQPRLWVHASCPDCADHRFGLGVRRLLPNDAVVNADPASRAGCCGSLLRAAGKETAALEQGARRAAVACEAGADAVVTACMSCAASLTVAQDSIPAVHYLEFLCDCPIDWRTAAGPMAVRFLLGEDVPCSDGSRRSFVSLSPSGEGD